MSDERVNLRQLASDIVDGKVFGSWMCDSEAAVRSSFMVLALMDEDQFKAMIVEPKVAQCYEYLDKAGPMAVNGNPVFFSMRTLTETEFAELRELVTEAKKLKEDFVSKET